MLQVQCPVAALGQTFLSVEAFGTVKKTPLMN